MWHKVYFYKEYSLFEYRVSLLLGQLLYVMMLAKERHREHQKVERKTYIQVTKTKYKWTGLDSS